MEEDTAIRGVAGVRTSALVERGAALDGALEVGLAGGSGRTGPPPMPLMTGGGTGPAAAADGTAGATPGDDRAAHAPYGPAPRTVKGVASGTPAAKSSRNARFTRSGAPSISDTYSPPASA